MAREEDRMIDTAFVTAGECARMIREGETTSENVVERLLARIEIVNPSINAIVALNQDAPKHARV